eukprot:7910012-Pyramimonas_sp.AAC.1
MPPDLARLVPVAPGGVRVRAAHLPCGVSPMDDAPLRDLPHGTCVANQSTISVTTPRITLGLYR